MSRIEELGARLVAISPQVREKSAEVKEKNRLSFPILSDPGNEYSDRLGLRFALPEELRDVYRSFGIDLPSFNGDASWTLPIPARIVVSSEGVVLDVDADPDYTRRPEPEATLAVLEGRG